MRSVKVKLGKDGWPDSIPWPRAGEYNTLRMTDGYGRCCLAGWASVALHGSPRAFDPSINPAARAVDRRMQHLATLRGFRSYTRFNDHPDTTDADREKFWRETWEHFGYRGPG